MFIGGDIVDTEIEIEKIVRTERKSIALQVTDDATLIVRAPVYVDDETIERVVLKRKYWIEKNRNSILKRDPKFSTREFVNGEGFLYLGKYYKLTIVDEQETALELGNGFCLSRELLPNARQVFILWYSEKAHEKISERAKWYAQKSGFEYNNINITKAQKRWGSCSSKRNLNFSWRLIMAPLSVVDYVVVHELVHLEEKNHTKMFRNKVKMLMPNYEKHKEWLKRNGYLLRL
jgi:predicted metal-dependent hydrolase